MVNFILNVNLLTQACSSPQRDIPISKMKAKNGLERQIPKNVK